MTDDADFDRFEMFVKKGDLLGVRAWLQNGGDPDLRNRFGWTPLMLAAMHGRTDIAGLLLASGADPNRVNEFGETAKSVAEVKGFHRTAELIESSSGGWPGA